MWMESEEIRLQRLRGKDSRGLLLLFSQPIGRLYRCLTQVTFTSILFPMRPAKR